MPNPKVHFKLEVVRQQFERALQLYLDEKDYVCAITLAGAAEEPLGKMLKYKTDSNLLENLAEVMATLIKKFGGETPSRKEAIANVNRVRDWLKHYKDGTDLEFDAKWEAHEIIDRAISSYFELIGEETELMRRFKEEA